MLSITAEEALPLLVNRNSGHGVQQTSNLHQPLLLRVDYDLKILNWKPPQKNILLVNVKVKCYR